MMQEPSLSHSLPRFGCLAGTFSPSRRQIRSTRLWFTRQPLLWRRAVILRYPYRPYSQARDTTFAVRTASSSATLGVYR